MPRTSKPAERRKDEILDAAQHLFTTKGFQATTVEDVLAAVGIAKGTLYYHFAGKDEVLRGLILRTVNRMADQAKAIAEGDGPAVEKFFAVLAATRVDGQDAELVGEFHAPGNAEFHLMSIVETVRRLTPILAEIVAERSIQIGVIAVPAAHAQHVADQLVAAGISGIWNFAPVKLHVPPSVPFVSEDLSVGLSALSYYLTHRSTENDVLSEKN